MYPESRIRILETTSKPRLVAVTLLALASVTAQTQVKAQGYARVLDTPGFSVRIEVKCPEGHVTCESVSYQGTSKRTKKTLSLSGRTLHRMCADGVTPCHLLGYIFKNGAFTYFVRDGGELLVREGDKVVVQEAGAWQ